MTNPTDRGLGGIVLAGGQSRRMGAAKALLRLAPDGPTVIERVLERVATVADAIIIVTNTPDAYAWLGRQMVGDLIPGLGALAGIHAGLSASSREHNLVVACDMPFLNPALLAHMACRPRQYDVLIPHLAGGMPETMHAIYGRACLAPVEEQLAAGDGKITRFFDRVRVEVVDDATLRALDPDLRSLSNMNTPEDFAAAQATYATERSAGGAA